MKKFSKSVIALLTSLVFCIVGGGYLTSCSSDDGGDNKVTFTSQTETVSNNAETLGAITATLAVSDESVATAGWSDDNKTSITITSLKAGTTEVTATLEDESDYATISVTVASDGKITANVTKKVGEEAKEEEEEGDLTNLLTYNFDELTSTPTTVEGDNSILDGNVIYWVAANKTGNAKVTENSDATHHYLQVSAGGAIDTSATTIDLSNQTTYLKVKAAQAGQERIVFTFTTVKGGSDSDNRILIVDPDTGAVLGQTETVACGTADDNTEKTLEVTCTVPETFYVVFARSNGKGGFKFTKIDQYYGTAATLSSISATTTKSEYALSEDFDESTVTVKATYDTGKSKTVTGWTTDAATSFTKGTAGSYTITISYTEGEVTKTCELPVTVKDKSLDSIAVKTEPTKTEYTEGDAALDLTGLVLTLTYDDESKSEVSYSSSNKDDFSVSGFDSSAATESQAITVTYGGKTATFNVVIKEKVYFSAFDVTSTGVTANTSDNSGSYTATDGTWSVTGAKIQFTDSNNNSVGVNTYDYDAEAGKGYAYTGRVNIKNGKFTISTKADTILRIDGGSGSNGAAREFAISGADKTSWKPSTGTGSFFFKATSETVTITIGSDACNIYGVHVVDTELDPVELSSVTTYTKPTLELSATSVIKDKEVTATVTVPQSVTKTTMSDGTVTETKAEVTAEITYKVATVTGETVGDYSDATVTGGKVDTSSAGTFAYTASYTIGTGDDAVTYTSDPVTLEVVGEFAATTENVANNEATLGLTATSVSSSAEDIATVEINGDNIVITSVAAGTATITASDGTNSATIEVTVGAGGAITTEVKKYSAVTQYTLTPDMISSWTDAKTELTDITTTGAKFQAGAGVTYDVKQITTGSIKLGGSAQKAGKNCVVFTTTSSAAKVTVVFQSSNTDGRYIVMNAGTDSNAVSSSKPATGAIYDDTVTATEKGTDYTVTLTCGDAGTYSLGATNGVYIKSVLVEM